MNGLINADKVADKTEYENRAGAFPLKVEFPGDDKNPEEGKGARILGTYVKRDQFKGDKGKMVNSHVIALRGISPALVLFKGKDPEAGAVKHDDLAEGQLISLTGAVLDGCLTDADFGKDLRITYDGRGEKKRGQNRAKLFTVGIAKSSKA